jgi:hypothetical protein
MLCEQPGGVRFARNLSQEAHAVFRLRDATLQTLAQIRLNRVFLPLHSGTFLNFAGSIAGVFRDKIPFQRLNLTLRIGRDSRYSTSTNAGFGIPYYEGPDIETGPVHHWGGTFHAMF